MTSKMKPKLCGAIKAEQFYRAGRADHQVVRVGNQLIPILGTVGGTAEQSRQTARNIEQFFAARKEAP